MDDGVQLAHVDVGFVFSLAQPRGVLNNGPVYFECYAQGQGTCICCGYKIRTNELTPGAGFIKVPYSLCLRQRNLCFNKILNGCLKQKL